jgi:predicted phage-related endonuclease
VIALRFAEGYGGTVHPSPGLMRSDESPIMLATPDRLLASDPDDPAGIDAVLEFKTAAARSADYWDSGVPLWYQTQVQWYLRALGLERAEVAVLIGGQDYRVLTVDHDRAASDLMMERVGAWWDRHVIGGVEPEPAGAADAALVERLHAEVRESVTVSESTADLLSEYAAARARARAAAGAADDLRALLAARIGPGAVEVLGPDGRRLGSWKAHDVSRIDVEALRAEMPEVAARYERRRPSFVLRVAGE